GDVTLMMQYSTYSVISPEGCAAILWKSAENAGEAAESLAITSTRLKALGVIDKVIAEPLGGAHRDHAEAAKSLKKAIQEALRGLQDLSPDQLLERRQERWVNYGKFKEVAEYEGTHGVELHRERCRCAHRGSHPAGCEDLRGVVGRARLDRA